MKLFKKENFVSTKVYLNEDYQFYAHLKKVEQDTSMKEELQHHISLCEKYFLKLDDAKNLTNAFKKIYNIWFQDTSKQCQDLYVMMIQNVISFHDFGKFNPQFQKYKMKNILVNKSNVTKDMLHSSDDHYTNHSMLSAILYINYFREKISQYPVKEKQPLRYFLYLNAYLISRHHSNLGAWNNFSMFSDEMRDAFTFLSSIDSTYLIEDLTFNIKLLEIDIKINSKFRRQVQERSDHSIQSINLYTYARLLYSVLVASDYYGTTEFMNGVAIEHFGDLKEIEAFYDVYQNSSIYQHTLNYKNGMRDQDKPINNLRSQAFWETQEVLLSHLEEPIYFLKAPTGIGKSNIALNLSLLLAHQKRDLQKIYYVYPFNTLVEQTRASLKEVFGDVEELYSKIVTINSITPIKTTSKQQGGREGHQRTDNNQDFYNYDLLNRQFLNYPFILTTSVSIFQTMFGSKQSDVFAFHQLMNSVIVLDEIQSYKNTIWAEIIQFLQVYAEILNIKIIIMSATLPDLGLFLEGQKIQNLLIEPERYFHHPLFSNRVGYDYSLLDQEYSEEALLECVLPFIHKDKRILIEFITKKSATEFYQRLKEIVFNKEMKVPIEFISGDDNEIERDRIIKRVKQCQKEKTGLVLIATQVIEAGVDIDMEIGFKDISKLDSEEQFMGRINRSCHNKEPGIVYFFDLNQVKNIYREDIRADRSLTLKEANMRQILDCKDYDSYYEIVIERLKEYKSRNDRNSIEDFYKSTVATLDFPKVAERLRLIDEDQNQLSVFLARKITVDYEDGQEIVDGEQIWNEYKLLLQNMQMEYSEKIIKLSYIMSKMSYFIYQIRSFALPPYDDNIGEIYAIFDSEQYFEDGKLNREVLEGGGTFI